MEDKWLMLLAVVAMALINVIRVSPSFSRAQPLRYYSLTISCQLSRGSLLCTEYLLQFGVQCFHSYLLCTGYISYSVPQAHFEHCEFSTMSAPPRQWHSCLNVPYDSMIDGQTAYKVRSGHNPQNGTRIPCSDRSSVPCLPAGG